MKRETKVVLAWTAQGERWAVVFLGRLTAPRYVSRRGALALLRELRSGRRAPDYGSGALLPPLLWPRDARGATRH